MGLSNERPQNTATLNGYRDTLARIAATNLANRLIRYEHNPDPREAPNPAHSVTRIRTLRPIVRVQVDDSCKDHNSAVASLGAVEQYEHLWEGRG
jgi:hypothetical protein